MAGSTGKMTREAIMARGPRMQLLLIKDCACDRALGFFVAVEGPEAPVLRSRAQKIGVYARSYSLSYLLKVGRCMMSGVPEVIPQ